jgi:zinc transporter ZupT
VSDDPLDDDDLEDPQRWGPGVWAQEEGPPAPWPTVTPASLAVTMWWGVGLLLVVLLGVGALPVEAFRPVLLVLSGAFVAAAVLRMVLDEERAGMLRIRRKAVDVVAWTVLAGTVVTLALLVRPAA